MGSVRFVDEGRWICREGILGWIKLVTMWSRWHSGAV